MIAIKISRFVADEASGSGISDPAANSGYDADLVREMHRIGSAGGTINVSPTGARDLAEWLECIIPPLRDERNYSGMRSVGTLADKCLRLAARAEQEEG